MTATKILTSKVCTCEHRQDEHKLSKAACRKPWCDCVRFNWSGEMDPPTPKPAEPEPVEVEPVDLAAVTEQAADEREVEAADEREAKRTGGTFAAKYLGPAEDTERFERLERELGEARAALADGEEGRKVLVQQRDAARADLAEARTDLDLAKAELSSARQEREQAEAATKTAVDSLASALASAEDELDTTRKERDEARELVKRMAAAAHLEGDGDPVIGVELLYGFWREADARNRQLAAKLGDTTRPDQGNQLARYERWFCQPITGCGAVAHAPDDTHECGPLIQATVTITHEGAPTA